jgi:hypothetical protein
MQEIFLSIYNIVDAVLWKPLSPGYKGWQSRDMRLVLLALRMGEIPFFCHPCTKVRSRQYAGRDKLPTHLPAGMQREGKVEGIEYEREI